MNKQKKGLSDKVCIPCQGEIPSLASDAVHQLLAQLEPSWIITSTGHLYREYTFANFIQSMDFANKIAILAEKEAHHPDLKIAWGLCAVEIWTHKINGLTESDFILAAKIDKLL